MTTLPAFCPRCYEVEYKEFILPEEHIHYGKIICATCNTHIAWIPDPKVTLTHEERKRIINAALKSDGVTGWEKMFLGQMRNRRSLSPKQQEKYQQICTRHGLDQLTVYS